MEVLSRDSSVGRASVLSHTVSSGMIAYTNASQVHGRDSSAAMLATKRLAGVTPEVNLGELLCQMQIRLSTLALKSRGDVTRSPKQGYQWPHKKDSCPPKILKNKKKNCVEVFILLRDTDAIEYCSHFIDLCLC